MPTVNLQHYSFGHIKCFLELGATYRIWDQWHGSKDCKLIRTGKKGFNFLDIKTNRLLFKRPVYMVNSANKIIAKDRKIFEIVLQNWIRKIENDTSGPPTENLIGKEKPVINNSLINALYRMEIEN